MKKINSILVRRFSASISRFMLFVYFVYLCGCSYYNVKTLDPLSSESVTEQVKKKDKYIILHFEERAWHLRDISIDDQSKEIKGTVENLPTNHMFYTKAKKNNKANQYSTKIKKLDRPIHEIHLYLSQTISFGDVTIPFSDITKVEVYDTHVGATVLTVLGIAAVVGVVIAAIIIATKSSCPFVYISDGYTYNFTGEMYGGAIYASLERDDYMPLPGFLPTNGEYQLRISNELLERQYTNLANLIVVEHPRQSTVILDKQGNVQTISSPQLPVEAKFGSSINLTKYIEKKDSSAYLFDEVAGDNKDISSLVLSFKKPGNTKTGKLILNAKNSYWLDYAYGKFNEQFGMYFNSFTEKQRKVPAEKHYQWSLEQNIPLSVYVQTENGWKFIDYFNSIGPLASRDIVMPIDLTKINGDMVTLKLECGFMFWEVDYAAMDFSVNTSGEIHQLKPLAAIDENGLDVSSMIEATDERYLIQPEIGNVVTITYKAPVKNDLEQTVFLHSRGYYEYIREYKNFPDLTKLKSFKNKGSFTRFSKEHYNEFSKNQDLFSASLTQPNGN